MVNITLPINISIPRVTLTTTTKKVAPWFENFLKLLYPSQELPLVTRTIDSTQHSVKVCPTEQSTTLPLSARQSWPLLTESLPLLAGVVASATLLIFVTTAIYETQYAHNSVMLVKAGESVKQGQVIAKVGSTGCSTGPHSHYQVKVNGELQNPLEVEFPKGDPITEDQLEEFNKQKSCDRCEVVKSNQLVTLFLIPINARTETPHQPASLPSRKLSFLHLLR